SEDGGADAELFQMVVAADAAHNPKEWLRRDWRNSLRTRPPQARSCWVSLDLSHFRSAAAGSQRDLAVAGARHPLRWNANRCGAFDHTAGTGNFVSPLRTHPCAWFQFSNESWTRE